MQLHHARQPPKKKHRLTLTLLHLFAFLVSCIRFSSIYNCIPQLSLSSYELNDCCD